MAASFEFSAVVDYVQSHPVKDIIHHYGADVFYLITFVWTFIEGETFVIFAGIAAAHDLLKLHWLILSAWLGSFAGDQVFFWVGRKYGVRILERIPKLRKGKDMVTGWVEKHSTGFILSYRFMYGLRNISALAIGMSHIPWQRYFRLNLLAALIWATSFAGTGYVFGDVIAKNVKNPALAVTLTLLLMISFILGIKVIVARLHARKEKRTGQQD